MLVSKDPTSDKDLLVSFVAHLMIEDAERVEGGLDILKNLNNSQMQSLHDITLEEMEYPVVSFINKSLKLCYGGSRVIGLSSTERNSFITDLRKYISNYYG